MHVQSKKAIDLWLYRALRHLVTLLGELLAEVNVGL